MSTSLSCWLTSSDAPPVGSGSVSSATSRPTQRKTVPTGSTVWRTLPCASHADHTAASSLTYCWDAVARFDPRERRPAYPAPLVCANEDVKVETAGPRPGDDASRGGTGPASEPCQAAPGGPDVHPGLGLSTRAPADECGLFVVCR